MCLLLQFYSSVKADDETISDLTTLPVTANYHHWCLSQENFTLCVHMCNIVSR